MLKALLKYIFIGFLAWLFFTKSGIYFKSQTSPGSHFESLLPKSEYAPHCMANLKNQLFDKATACYKQALIGDAANPEIRYYLALSMYMDKDFEGAKFHSDFIVKNLPKSRYAPFAKKISDAAFMDETEKSTLENSGNADYLADLETATPWKRMPIRVWVQHSTNNANLRRAFNIWQTALYPTISFQMVSNKEDGDILVTFDDPTAKCSEKLAVGCTLSYFRKNDPKHTVRAVIALTSFDAYGRRVTDNELFSTLSHEIGHALGIHGHSKNRSDIMYPDTSNFNRRLTKRDINTVRKIYAK